MSFASLTGNQRNKEILQRLLHGGRVGGALLFAGPEGIGKRQFALTLAKATNCAGRKPEPGGVFPTDSCDECPMCRRIDAGSCGDIVILEPDGQYIKIAQTRSLVQEVQYRPRETRQRFFLIDQADRLREEAANSLLKTLEEPPGASTIILITSRPDALLITIRSRTRKLTFAPLSAVEMTSYLHAKYQRPAPDTALLARVTGGRIGQAATIDITEYRRERREIIELLELLSAGRDRHRLVKAAEYYGKQERDAYERKLGLLTMILRDLLLLAAGAARDAVVNFDTLDRLEPMAGKIGVARLLAITEKFNGIRHNLRVNVNRQLATESALLELASLF
ncbi:MAG: DNA polymerase III subunit delta' [Blastocatellia bacterium]